MPSAKKEVKFQAFEIGDYVTYVAPDTEQSENKQAGVVVNKKLKRGSLYCDVYIWGQDHGDGTVDDGITINSHAKNLTINPEMKSAFEDRGPIMFELLMTTYNARTAQRLIHQGRSTEEVSFDAITAIYNQWLKHVDEKVISLIMGIRLNKEKAMQDNVDLDLPIIFVKELHMDTDGKMKEYVMPIDGWKRIYKAYHTNKTLKSYILSLAETEIVVYA